MTTEHDLLANVRATRYEVSLLHEDDINAHLYAVAIESRGHNGGPELWAVTWMGRCLDAHGAWDYEPIPSSRTDDWLAEHRFDFQTALRLARQAAPGVTVNGTTAAQIAARQAGWEAS